MLIKFSLYIPNYYFWEFEQEIEKKIKKEFKNQEQISYDAFEDTTGNKFKRVCEPEIAHIIPVVTNPYIKLSTYDGKHPPGFIRLILLLG